MSTGGGKWVVVVGLVVVGVVGVGACRKRKPAGAAVVPVPTRARPPVVQPETRGPQQDWREALRANGLARYEAALAKMVRPAVHLATRKVRAADLAIGQSRIGGVPDLPTRFRWPTYKGKHLAFIAEVNLGDVARVMPEGPLPKEGHLWFFFAWSQEQWGSDPKDAGSAVVHYEANAKLARRALPGDIPTEGRFGSCGVTLRPYDDLPDGTDERNPTLGRDDETQLRYDVVRNRVASAPDGPSHKLLGYPQTIQGAMESECATASNGVSMGDGKGDEDPRFKELDATRYDWHLLMQIDSDDDADMMWGDAGVLYFWIRDQDLRARRFDKTWMIFQCG